MNTDQPTTWGKTVRERMRAKAMRGVPTGPVPLGYKKVHERGEVRVEIDKSASPLVQEAFGLAALKRNSLRDVLTAVTERGLISQRGTQLHPSGLWRILTNPFYIGLIGYDGELFAGSHMPLVSKGLFEQVQSNLQNRTCR